ncbi:TetR family transcriptional regulator [Vibrio sp.]|uniref:TetR family transcriptional regulator n=1 Tax=Vibrio sp. TaxID=678 RepID=UPI003D1128F3
MSLRERKKQQTRQRLLEIAAELFSNKSFDEVMVDEIVAKADISQKTFFNYFPSKASLLEELLLNWLQEVNVSAFDDDTPLTVRSAIVPTNMGPIEDWIIEHRDVLKMIMRDTDLFSSVYYSHVPDDGRNQLFPPDYRKPRVERVQRAQDEGVIRQDMPASMVCDLYNYLRLDMVQRWLVMPDEQATAEAYKLGYNQMLTVFLQGVQPPE